MTPGSATVTEPDRVLWPAELRQLLRISQDTQHPTIRTTRMTDRELLQKAARAAGYAIDEDLDRTDVRDNGGGPLKWNPLEDDGDALRLLVTLKLHLWRGCWPNGKRYVAAHKEWDSSDSMFYDVGTSLDDGDEFAATRRAIVRAAAAWRLT